MTANAPDNGGLIGKLGGTALASIPALSAMTFVVVAVKVFRVAGEDISTTVAIVSQANDVELLKNIVVTLLPGFLGAGVAAAISWWARELPIQPATGARAPGDADRTTARNALTSPASGLCAAVIALAFFTISWPFFLLLAAPFLIGSIWLVGQAFGRWTSPTRNVGIFRALRLITSGTALGLLVYLAVSPAAWLPVRAITVAPDHQVLVKGHPEPTSFQAYVLRSDADGTSLLIAKPRAVVDVEPGAIEPRPPLCAGKRSGASRFFFVRFLQLVHLEADNGSPYAQCPD
jgi:hypothetical protein